MSGPLLKVVFICAAILGLTGCGPSESGPSIPSDPDLRRQEVERLDREIKTNPADGNLYVAKMTLLLAEDSIDEAARELWASLYRVQGGSSILARLMNHPNKNIRKNAVCLAGEFRMVEALKILRRRAEDRDSEIRRVALKALRLLQDDKSFYLYALLAKDGDWAVRAEAAVALGMFQERDAITRLCKLLHDSDPNVQFQAAQSLVSIGKLHAPEMVAEFIRILEESNDPLETAAAGLALGRAKHERGIQATEKIVQTPGHPFRMIAVRVLLLTDAQRAARLFKEILAAGEAEEDVRAAMQSHLDETKLP